MLVKKLKMENIRSYKDAEVEFPGGRTLFEGDIGAGKSTILIAIEFALFGLGSSKASSLLRVGESKGSVELEFEAGGKDYWVRRVLAKKAASVQQVEGRLRGPDGEEDYPSSEMKERILGILNFREPTDPKSRSLIYQYAIYTAQEEMKQIIGLRPDLRLQILRRAFGVEEYKLAMENARDLLAKMRGRRGQFETASREAPSLRKELEDLGTKASRGEEELVKLERDEAEKESAARKLEAEREELHEVELRLASARPEHSNLKREIRERGEEAKELVEEVERLDQRAGQLEARRLGAPPGEKTQAELKVEVKSVGDDILRHEALSAALGTKIGQYESVAENGKCPICDRDASPEVFAEKIDGLSKEKKTTALHMETLRVSLQELEDSLERRRDYDALAAKVKDDLARVKEYRADAQKKRERLASVRANLDGNRGKLSDLEKRIEVLEKEAEGLEPLRRKIEASQKELKRVREEMSSLRRDVKNWREGIKRQGEALARMERAAAKAHKLRERELWLEEFFVPTLESIERHVMTSINREFGLSFQKWFSILVDDGGKDSRLDEDFTPMVDQEGYEQDIDFLSGGERTSVALAYRLALSQMVQKFAEAGPSSLILDEPTDGFSKEQLGKVREILDEMANPQVIIVSHERELESFADQIYRVVKIGNESKITR
ncbi:MAG TPA: SMC family ATPase [Nitrososphaerales archaeon]|nr:SMC family ATPase [Nitrososphaerales archaeon]